MFYLRWNNVPRYTSGGCPGAGICPIYNPYLDVAETSL